MRNSTFFLIALLVVLSLTAPAVLAQSEPLAAPQPQRGIQANTVPFYLPDRYLPAIRGPAFTVTTTADENDGTCDGAGTGLSLREALTICVDSDYVVVYVPAGTYTLSDALGEIDLSGTYGLTVVGASPADTIIESEEAAPRVGTNRLLYIYTTDYPLTLANLTLHNGNAGSGNGGALYVQGYGTVTLFNVSFENNMANYGGALYLDDDGDPIMVTMDSVAFSSNSALNDGGAIYFDGAGDSGHSVFIQNSTFISNVAGTSASCDYGGGAIAINWIYDYGGSVTIDNSLLDSNSLECEGFYGGAVMFYNYGSGVLNITYSSLTNNSAPGDFSYGGAVYTENEYGVLNVGYSYFEGNTAGYGGAIYDYYSYSANINQSAFFFNTALTDGGGAYFASGYGGSIQNALFLGNTAGEDGGAVYASLEPFEIVQAQFTLNRAGDVDGLNGYGGGLFLEDYGATLHNSLVEDNYAEFGPDCYTYAAAPPTDPVTSLGGSGITSTIDCDFIPHPTDQFDNLLLNGGFEFPYDDGLRAVNEKIPDKWTVKNAAGDKRACNGAKSVSPFGNCAYVFKGGAGENTQISQNVDLLSHTFADGEELLLFALGDGGAASKVKLQAIAIYTDTLLGKTKAKLTFTGANSTYEPAPGDVASLVLTDGDLSKLTVKIKNTSTAGKFYLDRVYLFSTAPFTPRNRASVVLPPSAPPGFRGN